MRSLRFCLAVCRSASVAPLTQFASINFPGFAHWQLRNETKLFWNFVTGRFHGVPEPCPNHILGCTDISSYHKSDDSLPELLIRAADDSALTNRPMRNQSRFYFPGVDFDASGIDRVLFNTSIFS
jgi:hypothetical protein